MTDEGMWLEGLDPYSEHERNDEDYLEPCENLVTIPEDDEHDRDPGEGLCGGRITVTGGHGYYNGRYDCYTMYLHCDRCGDYEVECV